jgi:hypothetical protein
MVSHGESYAFELSRPRAIFKLIVRAILAHALFFFFSFSISISISSRAYLFIRAGEY